MQRVAHVASGGEYLLQHLNSTDRVSAQQRQPDGAECDLRVWRFVFFDFNSCRRFFRLNTTLKAFQTFQTLICFHCAVSSEQEVFTYFGVFASFKGAELQFSRILIRRRSCKMSSRSHKNETRNVSLGRISEHSKPYRSAFFLSEFTSVIFEFCFI